MQTNVQAMLPARRCGWGLGTFDIGAADHRWVGHDGLYGGYASGTEPIENVA
ncbi:MAG: hypothetical protein ACR2OC_05530 [Solirubrobacterales bacterium]